MNRCEYLNKLDKMLGQELINENVYNKLAKKLRKMKEIKNPDDYTHLLVEYEKISVKKVFNDEDEIEKAFIGNSKKTHMIYCDKLFAKSLKEFMEDKTDKFIIKSPSVFQYYLIEKCFANDWDHAKEKFIEVFRYTNDCLCMGTDDTRFRFLIVKDME